MISHHFNEEELRDLYFNVDIDYENHNGGKSNHVLSLVLHFARSEGLSTLSEVCRQLKPGLDWPKF
jgi:hypothetical protein